MASHQLINSNQPAGDPPPLTIAAILDTSPVTFPWIEELISFTVSLINNHADGWFDDVLLQQDGATPTPLQYTLSDSACKHDVAVRAYLNLTRGGNIPNAIVGTRCSAPAVAIASLASAENVALISPAASVPRLTDHYSGGGGGVEESTTTSNRLVAPDDTSGQAGALVSLLREFGWTRISIINTDRTYGVDFAVELARAWQEGTDGDGGGGGEIGSRETVQVGSNNQIEVDSVKQLFENWPVDDPRINSRVVVLLAHHNHAYQILKIASEMGFQKDTIYIGVDAWTGRDTPKDLEKDDASWMPDIPGYIGIVPYTDPTSPVYLDYLERLQANQRMRGVPVTTQLEDSYAVRTVDSILALAMALSNVASDQRHNGTAVTQALRNLRFDGISGPVEFNDKGDWANPRYTVMTLPKRGSEFIPIGSVSPGGPVRIDMSKICYPQIGCNVDHPPSATYPVPSEVLWSVVLVGVLGAIVAVLGAIAYRIYHSRRPLKEKLRSLQAEIEGLDSNDGAVRQRKGSLYKEIARLLDQPRPPNWTEDHGLVPIPPTDQEYWTVLQKMRETTNEQVWISELSRCQNDGVWSYYVFRKNQLASKYGVDLKNPDAVGEIDAWHGTSSLNPDVIYNDNHDGFMMQFSSQGLYGRGLYFAERFDYSDCYSYRVNAATTHLVRGSIRQEGEDREIFLVKLLVGQSITMSHVENEEECRSLVTAPENPNTNGLRYDTVSGMVADETKIHTVYENGRAYPSYLIRYYKGPRDPTRTQFETQEEAMADSKMQMDVTLITLPSDMDDITNSDNGRSVRNDNTLSSSITATPIIPPPHPIIPPPVVDDIEQGSQVDQSEPLWMYEDDQSRPAPFDRDLQSTLERAYQADPGGSITIQKGTWAYNVDFVSMTQTNRDHPAHRRRSISRVELRT